MSRQQQISKKKELDKQGFMELECMEDRQHTDSIVEEGEKSNCKGTPKMGNAYSK